MTEYIKKHGKSIATALLSAFAVSGLFLWIRFSTIFPFTDPDLFFHFKVSEIWNRTGMPMFLPQYDLIGWDRLFGEKEFLFHAVTSAGWKWLQERGVIIVALGVTVLNLFQLTYFTSRRLGGLWGFALSALVLLPSSEFLLRASMVRPQVMGMFFWTWVIFSFIYRSRIAIFLSCFLYIVSYHLAAIPLLLLGVFTVFLAVDSKSWRVFRSRSESSVVLWGIVGILCGFVLNPYFPGNALVSLQVLKIPFLMSSGEQIPFGQELWPKSSNQYLVSVLASFFCAACLIRIQFKNQSGRLYARVLLILILAMIGLKGFNPRTIEYLIPLTLVCAVWVFENIDSRWMRRGFFLLMAAFQFPLGWAQYKGFRGIYGQSRHLEWAADRRTFLSSIKNLPADKFKRLFHCEWHQSVYWFYAGPQSLKFVDLLDPTFLLLRNLDLYHLRQQIVSGEELDPYLPILSVFGADLVACGGGKLSQQMTIDPRFRRLPSVENNLVGRVAYLDDSRSSHFVRNWKASTWTVSSRDELRKGSVLRPKLNEAFLPLSTLTQERQIEDRRVLFPLFAGDPKSSTSGKSGEQLFCRQAQTDAAWARQNSGSDLVGWGGGPHVRIWRNQQALFKMEGEQPVQSVLQGLIQLKSPIRSDDVFYVMVCSELKSDSWISLSAWKDSEMQEWCRDDQRDSNPSWRRVTGWQSIGGPRGNCYANYEP